MDTVCFRVKLKRGCLSQVRTWFKTLQERESEVLKTLENEGTIVESVFLEPQGEDFYLIYYIKAKNLTLAKEIAMESLLPIDLYHKVCREKFCEGQEKLEQLVDFHRINVDS